MTFSFAGKRFNALLRAQAFGVVGALVLRLSDLFVSGNVVGVDALAGIAAVMPVTIGAMFVGKLVYCGSGYLFAKYPGEFRNDLAREGVEFTKTIAASVASICGDDVQTVKAKAEVAREEKKA